MKVTLLLADAAQVASDKLYVLGGGWRFIGPDVGPTAIAGLIEVPWDMTNRSFTFEIELLDADGRPAQLTSGSGFKVGGQFEAGRPAGLPPGSTITVPLAINLPPLPIPPGGEWEWRFSIEGLAESTHSLPFITRPAPPAQPGPPGHSSPPLRPR